MGPMASADGATNYISARICVTLDCPECASPIPVNGVVDQVLCAACQSVIHLEDELSWQEIMTYAKSEGCREHGILVNSERMRAMD